MAQTPSTAQNAAVPVQSLTIPSYVGAGASFNQIGTPRFTMFATAVVPISSTAGVYTSSTADIIPIIKIDSATGRKFYTFQTSLRQGAHKVLYDNKKVAFLLGGDIGPGFSGSTGSGMNVGLTGSLTATFVYQFHQHWAFIMPIRGFMSNNTGGFGVMNLIPEAGFVWKP